MREKFMLGQLSISVYGDRKTVTKEKNEIADRYQTAPALLSMSKHLMKNSQRLSNVLSAATEARGYWSRISKDWDGGFRIFRATEYTEIINELSEKKAKIETATNNFANNMEEEIESARIPLGKLFDEKEFPTPDEIKNRFRFDFHVTMVPDANDFRMSVAEDSIKDLEKQLEERHNTNYHCIIRNMVRDLGDLLKPMGEKLEAETLRQTTINKVDKIIADLESWNEIFENEEVAAVVKRVKEDVTKVSAESMTLNPFIKDKVEKSLESVQNSIEAFL